MSAVMKRVLGIMVMTIALTSFHVSAQTFPSKPIRIVTGNAPGGLASNMTRLMADELGRQLSQSVIVEDKPGANGVIGAKSVMSARADGYTLHVGSINSHSLLVKSGIDLEKEMVPIGVVFQVPMVIMTSTTGPLKTTTDLVAFARSIPGQLNYARSGSSTVQRQLDHATLGAAWHSPRSGAESQCRNGSDCPGSEVHRGREVEDGYHSRSIQSRRDQRTL